MLKFFMRKKKYFFLKFLTQTSLVEMLLVRHGFQSLKILLESIKKNYKGFSEGVFYSCDYAGQSATYNVYNLNEFLSNKEFNLFKKLSYELNLIDTKTYVHRITCNGNNGDRSFLPIYNPRRI